MGFVNVFLFFNMGDGPSKDMVIIYYGITLLEGNQFNLFNPEEPKF